MPFLFIVGQPVLCVTQIPLQLALVLVPFLPIDRLPRASDAILCVPSLQYRFPDDRYKPSVLLSGQIQIPDLAADFNPRSREFPAEPRQLSRFLGFILNTLIELERLGVGFSDLAKYIQS